MHARTSVAKIALVALTGSLLTVLGVAAAPVAGAAQPVPGHTGLVPQTPRTNTARISDGEISDIEVVGSRVYVAGTFTSIANSTGAGSIPQKFLAAYNIDTGQVDTGFRPTFGGGGVTAVEASPDGTKLYAAGAFSTVNGVTKRKIASLDPATGAPLAGFTANASAAASALAVTNSTVYVGGRFTTINGTSRVSLAALNGATGAVDPAFNLPLSGGIGISGALTVQQLKLTHDETKLLVVHTGRAIAGQTRYGVGLIDTATKSLLPWRTRLWDDNLAFVGGIQRVYAGDIAPNDQYFVVTSGSGGDRPPINDTAVSFSLTGADNVAPLWVSRHFDSVYSVAITEKAVYLGGHFSWEESPTSPQPWPGLDNVGYGTGQGLSGYGLGDSVVRRDHIGALDPATGTALEWSPGSDSFEGNKAMEATSRGLFAGGDATFQGGIRTGRVAFYDLATVPAASPTDTLITTPIEGRVVPAATPFLVSGTATAPSGVKRVQIEVINRTTKQYLQDDLVTWGLANTINTTLATPNAAATTWSLPLTIPGTLTLQLTAKAVGVNGTSDATKASKKMETFSLADLTPDTAIVAPVTTSPVTTTSFTITGTATDDHGVSSLTIWFKNLDTGQYLQDDGTTALTYNAFRSLPDIPGATAATWRYDVVLPTDGRWQMSAIANDTAGQADLRGASRIWIVDTNGVAPSVTISTPVPMNPPGNPSPVTVAPGTQLTITGTATDENALQYVDVYLRNGNTREGIAADGSFNYGTADFRRISGPSPIGTATYAWTYTTPPLTAGVYDFRVRAVDNSGLVTASTNYARLAITAQVAADAFPVAALTSTLTDQTPEVLHLDIPGTATDDKGVSAVRVALFDNRTGRWLQPNGQLTAGFASLPATLSAPGGTSTGFTFSTDLPSAGDYSVSSWAVDTAGQWSNASGSRYLVFPGDLDPTIDPLLAAPVTNTIFDVGRLVVSGRANDDLSMAKVEIGIINSAGQYLGSTGTFSPTVSYRSAFLTSPGSPGSNYAYTSPIVPAGTYTVLVRATDNNGQVGPTFTATNVIVTQPPGNLAPVAAATVSCTNNVCRFDARGSTDENIATASFTWTYGTNQGTGTGSLVDKVYTAPGPFSAVLTVRDEWGLTSTLTLTANPTANPANLAPVAVVGLPTCVGLSCTFSGASSYDTDGAVVAYAWTFGDGLAGSTLSTASHTLPAAGTYTVTLTVTDGFGKQGTATRQVTV